MGSSLVAATFCRHDARELMCVARSGYGWGSAAAQQAAALWQCSSPRRMLCSCARLLALRRVVGVVPLEGVLVDVVVLVLPVRLYSTYTAFPNCLLESRIAS